MNIKLLLKNFFLSVAMFPAILPYPAFPDKDNANDEPLNKVWVGRAESGNAEAQTGVGNWYENDHNYPEAAKWFRKASEQGDTSAETRLGLLYVSGKGVPRNYSEAAKWFYKAAQQGNIVAQERLGALYENGQGVPKDYVQAYKWSQLAAAQHYNAAIERRGNLEKVMTPQQVVEGIRLSREWLAQHSQDTTERWQLPH